MSINFVTAMAVKSFDVPDKKRCPDKAEFDLCTVNDYSVARLILGPGWRWSVNTRPYERTDVCLHHHLGFCISGEMVVETAEGLRSTMGGQGHALGASRARIAGHRAATRQLDPEDRGH